MDDAELDDADDVPSTTFGTLEVALVATFQIELSTVGQSPCEERHIARDTLFSFSAWQSTTSRAWVTSWRCRRTGCPAERDRR